MFYIEKVWYINESLKKDTVLGLFSLNPCTFHHMLCWNHKYLAYLKWLLVTLLGFQFQMTEHCIPFYWKKIPQKLQHVKPANMKALTYRRQQLSTASHETRGHIPHLRHQFNLINTRLFIITLTSRGNNPLLPFWESIGPYL